MTKRHFIALADTLRLEIFPELTNSEDAEMIIRKLARFCEDQNPRFDRERWEGYIHGTCGPNGGRKR